ncbi:hypothetical protein HDV02_001806 [Globomyces sp. JEL0801]|nr:hypothetical protein HDV02_001806 [Globomyces sp. JEL0801]
MGVRVMTSQWYQERMCDGIPNVVYDYEIANISIKVPPSNETWPTMYKFQASKTPLSRGCFGTVKVPLSKSCCVSSLYPKSSKGYYSGSTIQNDFENIIDGLPTTANNQNYCVLKSLSKESLFGYKSVFYLSNDKCISPEGISCNSDGLLSLYKDQNCSGERTTIQLSANTTFTDNILGNFTGQIEKVQNAQTVYSWTIYIPLRELVPDFTYGIDILQVVLFSASFLFLSAVCFHYARLFYRKKTLYIFGLLLSQVLWLAFLVTRVVASFSYYTNTWEDALYSIQNFVWIVLMFIWDSLPPTVVAYSLYSSNSKTYWDRTKRILRADPIFILCLLGQMIVIVSYSILEYIRNNTEWLGSDRIWLAFQNAVGTFFLSLHAMLTSLLIERMNSLVNDKTIFDKVKAND